MGNQLNIKAHHEQIRAKCRTSEISIDFACKTAYTGDIVLFSGEAQTSKIVMALTGSQWSHVGIVYIPEGESEPYLFESIKSDDRTSTNIDYFTKRVKVGVRLVNLRHALTTFKGHAVAIRSMCLPLSFMQNPEYLERYRRTTTKIMKECVEMYHGKPYETSIYNFVFARFTCVTINEETRNAFFCSELVATCLMRLGFLEDTRSSIQYLPDDFCEEGTYKPVCPDYVCTYSLTTDFKVKLGKTHYIQIEEHPLVFTV